MSRNRIIITLIILSLKVSFSFAQIDTVFWFAAPWVTPGHAGNTPVALQISSFGNPTTIRVRQPAGTFDTTYTIPANSLFKESVNHLINSIENTPANTVLNRALKITSNFPITVVYDVITITNNPETFSVKGQNALGKEFLCPFQRFGNNGAYTPAPKSQIVIAATDNNTIVWITPKCNVVGHPANITYSVALSYGQSYNIENVTNLTTIPGNNLSGTIITSNKNIVVTVADDSVTGNPGTCRDLIGDQLVPVDIVGTDYIVVKGGLNPAEPEGAYIVATDNFTQLTINDGVITNTVLNKGDTYFYKLTQPLTSAVANKNVYLMHVSGFGCEQGAAILPPLNCAGSNQVAFTRNNAQPFYLNVLCKTTAINSFTLNGSTTSIPGSAFMTVPGNTLYSGAQIGPMAATLVPVGSNQLLVNNTDVFALGIFHGGATSGALYHYMSSFLRRTTVTTTSVAPVCVGQSATIALTGTVSGGAVTGLWSTSNGGGTFGSYTSTVNTISTVYTLGGNDTLNPNGIKFYLTSTGNCKPQKDSITIQLIQQPQLFANATPTSQCANLVQPISLAGSYSNAIGASWNGPSYIPPPGVNTTYTPSAADIAAGSIVFTLTSAGGCSVKTKTVMVGFTPPPVVNAGPSTYVCTNSQSLVLNGNVNGANFSIWNSSGTGLFFPNNASSTATYVLSSADLTLTALSFTLTGQQTGCSSVSDNLSVNIIPKPAVTAASVQPLCASSLVIPLSGTVTGSASQGNWSTPNGTGVFTQIAPANASYTMSANDTLAGNVTFILSSSGTVCPTENDTITVSILKAPVIQLASFSPTVCNNTAIALSPTVTGATSYIWNSVSNGTFTPLSGSLSSTTTVLGGQYQPSGSDVSNGNVVLILTASTGSCSASKSFTVGFQSSPTANFNTSSIRCKDSPVIFTDGSSANGTSSLSYYWNFGTGPNATSTSSNPIFTYTNVGSYVVSYTVTGVNNSVTPPLLCPDTVSKRINIYPIPNPDFITKGLCEGFGSQFKDSSSVSVGNLVSWTWQFGDGSSNSPIRNPVHTYTNQGSYNVALTVTSNYSCSATITKLVTINDQPDAQFGLTNNPAVAQEPIYFSDFSTPPSTIAGWYWNFGDEGSSTISNPNHSFENAGIFVVTLTVFDNNGCSDTISKSVEITLLPQVPTAFSPNGDSNNDLLFVKGGPFQKMLFRVYDNWGELLFETTDQKIGWDGKKNGIDQPVGVYVWTLEADMYNNRQVKKNGDVTLMR